MARIDIIREGGVVKFRPSNLISVTGDGVFWRNLDPNEDHWITEQGKPREHWFGAPLARFDPAHPADTTSELLPDGTITYVCALHDDGDGEHGTINATSLTSDEIQLLLEMRRKGVQLRLADR